MNNGSMQYAKKILSLIKKSDKAILPITILGSLLKVSLKYAGIIFSAIILNQLISQAALIDIMTTVYWMVGIIGVLSIGCYIFTIILKKKMQMLEYSIEQQIIEKNMSMDYVQLESKKVKSMLEEAKSGANSSGGLESLVYVLGFFIENMFSIIYAVILISQLFLIGLDGNNNTLNILFNRPTLSVFLILIIGLSVFLTTKLSKKMMEEQYNLFKGNVEYNRIFLYLFELTYDYNIGKDFRIYSMSDLIIGRMKQYNKEKSGAFTSYARATSKLAVYKTLIIGVVMIFAYTYVGVKASLGFIRAGSVISVAASITFMNTALSKAFECVNYFKLSKNYMEKYYDYLYLDSELYHGTLPVEKRDDNEYIVEFKNVSFKYPDTDTLVLDNVSFRIPLNKKLAIVGQNGAGKTTFIKLLCRLYDIDEGEITLNGIDIRKYDYSEYINLFSVVFQDFKLLSAKISENVSASNNPDKAKVVDALTLAGFKERLDSLTDGIDTELYQKTEQGVEISGGEAQKIAIARALYKDSPIVILDEPTAALDPISEAEIYSKFDNLIKDKTAIYISHRMSSCKFCDDILVFENGRIVEEGNHESLLKENGLYKKMWDAQAEYYK